MQVTDFFLVNLPSCGSVIISRFIIEGSSSSRRAPAPTCNGCAFPRPVPATVSCRYRLAFSGYVTDMESHIAWFGVSENTAWRPVYLLRVITPFLLLLVGSDCVVIPHFADSFASEWTFMKKLFLERYQQWQPINTMILK